MSIPPSHIKLSTSDKSSSIFYKKIGQAQGVITWHDGYELMKNNKHTHPYSYVPF
jgi:hypothetical protein